MSNPEVERSIEAILMVVDEPLSEVVLAQIIETPTEQILDSLHNLQNRYENDFRGFQLRQVSGDGVFIAIQTLPP